MVITPKSIPTFQFIEQGTHLKKPSLKQFLGLLVIPVCLFIKCCPHRMCPLDKWNHDIGYSKVMEDWTCQELVNTLVK